MNFLEVLKEEDRVDMQSRRSGHYFCISRFTLHSSKFRAGALTCLALVFMQAVSSVVLIRTIRLIWLSVLPLKPHNEFRSNWRGETGTERKTKALQSDIPRSIASHNVSGWLPSDSLTCGFRSTQTRYNNYKEGPSTNNTGGSFNHNTINIEPWQ